MIYREHEQVVAFGRWPFVGPIDWLTVASALVGGGVLLGAPLSVLLGLPMYVTFIGCTLLVGALVSQWGPASPQACVCCCCCGGSLCVVVR